MRLKKNLFLDFSSHCPFVWIINICSNVDDNGANSASWVLLFQARVLGLWGICISCRCRGSNDKTTMIVEWLTFIEFTEMPGTVIRTSYELSHLSLMAELLGLGWRVTPLFRWGNWGSEGSHGGGFYKDEFWTVMPSSGCPTHLAAAECVLGAAHWGLVVPPIMPALVRPGAAGRED